MIWGFPGGSAGKESVHNARDLGSIPGLERSLGEGDGYPLQYSSLENSMYYTVHGVAKSWTLIVTPRKISWRREWLTTPDPCLENCMDRGGWQATIHRVGHDWVIFTLWAFLVAQMVKKLHAMWEIWVLSLGWEDPLEEGMATHSSMLAWRIPMDGGVWQATVHGVTDSWAQLSD